VASNACAAIQGSDHDAAMKFAMHLPCDIANLHYRICRADRQPARRKRDRIAPRRQERGKGV